MSKISLYMYHFLFGIIKVKVDGEIFKIKSELQEVNLKDAVKWLRDSVIPVTV